MGFISTMTSVDAARASELQSETERENNGSLVLSWFVGFMYVFTKKKTSQQTEKKQNNNKKIAILGCFIIFC